MFDLGPDLPDDTLIEMVRLPTRIRNAAKYAGLKTIGDLPETTEETLASIPNLGPGSVKWLRARLRCEDRRRKRGVPKHEHPCWSVGSVTDKSQRWSPDHRHIRLSAS